MTTSLSWLDSVGRTSVHALAKSEQVQLTTPLLRFLEKFGDAVSAAALKNAAQAKRAARASTQLREVFDVVQKEVAHVFSSLNHYQRQEIDHVNTVRDVETRLPKVVLTVQHMPPMVIHVDRSYATLQKRCTYGFRSKERPGAKLTGEVAKAANYVKEMCRKKNWDISVSELMLAWIRVALDIPTLRRKQGSVLAVTKGPARPVPPVATDADENDNGENNAEAGVLFERSPSPEPRRKRSRPGLGSKKRRREDVGTLVGGGPAVRGESRGSGVKVGSPVSPGRGRKTNRMGMDGSGLMEAFRANRSAQVAISKRKMREEWEEKGLPSTGMGTEGGDDAVGELGSSTKGKGRNGGKEMKEKTWIAGGNVKRESGADVDVMLVWNEEKIFGGGKERREEVVAFGGGVEKRGLETVVGGSECVAKRECIETITIDDEDDFMGDDENAKVKSSGEEEIIARGGGNTWDGNTEDKWFCGGEVSVRFTGSEMNFGQVEREEEFGSGLKSGRAVGRGEW